MGDETVPGQPAEKAAHVAAAPESIEVYHAKDGAVSVPGTAPPMVQPKVIAGANGGFKRIPIASSLIKPLLGHGGAHITAVRRQHPFANIKVNHTPGSDSGSITITGRPDHVTQAEQAIWQTLAQTAPAHALAALGMRPSA